MIAAFDVHYFDSPPHACAAAIVFANWLDALPAAKYKATIAPIEPYVPGQFYRRELPCIVKVMEAIEQPLNILIIDGYARLNDRPGLGEYLYEHLRRRLPVIGVAKSPFAGAPAIEILRGTSHSPLFVTALGIDPTEGAARIQQMHGPHRIPTLLKHADALARGQDRLFK